MVESPSAELNAALAEGLIRLGGSAVQEDDLTLRTFLPPPAHTTDQPESRRNDDEAARDLALHAEHVLSESVGGATVRVSWAWQPDQDWLALWRAGLHPRRVGERFVIAPTWTLSELTHEPDDIVIAIDPQMAFGTGEHASTRGVLRLLEHAVPSGAVALDVGTGSAILAIAAVKLGATAVDAIDTDPDALANAEENIARNDTREVKLTCGVVDAAFLEARASHYDLILANVLRSVLEPLLPAFRRALRPGGRLILGGMLETETEPMAAAIVRARLELIREDHEEGWWSALVSA
jgi:ribosomal protein L11 methyltransferase